MHSQYKQIGNAVPVNLAKALGQSLVQTLNEFERNKLEQQQIKMNLRSMSDFSNTAQELARCILMLLRIL